MFGTFAFAAAGAYSAMKRKQDVFGVLMISFVTAFFANALMYTAKTLFYRHFLN
jgi:uncharacterized membrane protein YeiH